MQRRCRLEAKPARKWMLLFTIRHNASSLCGNKNKNDALTENFSARRMFERLGILRCCGALLWALTWSLGLKVVVVPQRKQVQECGQGDPDLLVKRKKPRCNHHDRSDLEPKGQTHVDRFRRESRQHLEDTRSFLGVICVIGFISSAHARPRSGYNVPPWLRPYW
jgi:hypothetical protein